MSTALADKARRDQKAEQLGAAIPDYEAELGEVTAEEMAARRRADREDAVVVRGSRSKVAGQTRRGGKARSG